MHVPNFMIVDFVSLIMSQLTTNAQNILHLKQRTRVHVWIWTVAPYQMFRWGY